MGQCLGAGLPGYGNHMADSWGQALGSILGALEAGEGHREPWRLSRDVGRRIKQWAQGFANYKHCDGGALYSK